jgi:hypothetical protein
VAALARVGDGESLVFYSRQGPSVRGILQAAAALARADLESLAEMDAAELSRLGTPSDWMPSAALIEQYFDGAQVWTIGAGEGGYAIHIVDS